MQFRISDFETQEMIALKVFDHKLSVRETEAFLCGKTILEPSRQKRRQFQTQQRMLFTKVWKKK